MRGSKSSVCVEVILFNFIQNFEVDKELDKLKLESKMDYRLDMNIISSINKSVWDAIEFSQIEHFKKYIPCFCCSTSLVERHHRYEWVNSG